MAINPLLPNSGSYIPNSILGNGPDLSKMTALEKLAAQPTAFETAVGNTTAPATTLTDSLAQRLHPDLVAQIQQDDSLRKLARSSTAGATGQGQGVTGRAVEPAKAVEGMFDNRHALTGEIVPEAASGGSAKAKSATQPETPTAAEAPKGSVSKWARRGFAATSMVAGGLQIKQGLQEWGQGKRGEGAWDTGAGIANFLVGGATLVTKKAFAPLGAALTVGDGVKDLQSASTSEQKGIGWAKVGSGALMGAGVVAGAVGMAATVPVLVATAPVLAAGGLVASLGIGAYELFK